MFSITLKQTKSLPEPGIYRVENEVLSTEGIPVEVFVFSQENTDEFSHVARMFDMATFPDEVDGEKAFYRKSTVSLDFSQVGTAETFASLVKERLEALISEYTAGAETFAGEETIVLTVGE